MDDVTVRLGAQLGPLKNGMGEAGRVVEDGTNRMRDSLRRLGDAADSWQTRWNQGLELAAKAARLFEATWDATIGTVIERGEQFDALGKQLATPVAELSKIEFAARQAGVGLETILVGYRSASRALVEASKDGSEANRVLVGGLGLTAAEIERLKSLAPHEVILELGAALEQYEDGADKATAAQLLFGRGFAGVLQLLRDGPETIRENIALSERLGLVMNNQQSAAADRLGDAISTLHAAWTGFFNRMLGDEELLNAVAAAVESGALWFADMGASIPDDEMDAFRASTIEAVDNLQELLRTLSRLSVDGFPGLVGAINEALVRLDRIAQSPGYAALQFLAGGLPQMGSDSAVPWWLPKGSGGGVVDPGVDSWRSWTGGGPSSLMTIPAPNGGAFGESTESMPWGETPEGPIGETPVPRGQPYGAPGARRPQLTIPGDASGGASAAAKARAEEFQAILREQQQQLAAERENAEQRLAIVTEFSQRIRERFGEESEEFDRQKLVQVQAEQQAQQQRDRLSLGAIEADKRRQLAEIELERDSIAFKKQMGQISDDEEIAALQALYDRRYEVLVTAIQRERELTGDDPLAQQGLDQEEGEAKGQLTADQQALLQQEQLNVKATFDQLFGAIGQGWDQTIIGMIRGTQTWQQGVANIGQNLLGTIINLGAQIVLRWASSMFAKLLISKTTDQMEVQSAAQAQAQKTAVQAPEIIQQIMNNAYGAASGGANAMASIPYVGPILAVANAAMLLALVAGYAANVSAAGGLDEVPSGGALAQLHPKETVLSADLAQRVRRMTATPEEMGLDPNAPAGRASGRGGNTFVVQAMDASSFEEFLRRNGDTVVAMLEDRRRLRNEG